MIGLRQFKGEETDRALVRRFARDHDGEAFSILMGRYADMVYTTCHRVLGDDAQAADAVQETFFQLLKNADRVTGSLASWLHRVATRRAVDIVRQNASRRRREAVYALDGAGEATTGSDIIPAVDQALEEVPDEARELLMLHFLQGRTTVQIAAAKGISQPTVSRRIQEALELLREKLREQGIQAAVVPLQAILLHSNQTAPELVRIGVAKIALAKAAWLHSGPVGGIAAKIALAGGAAALLASAIWVLRPELPPKAASLSSSVVTQPAQTVPAAAARPSTPQEEPRRTQSAVAAPAVVGSPAPRPNTPPGPQTPGLLVATPGPDPAPWLFTNVQPAFPTPSQAGPVVSYPTVPISEPLPWLGPGLPPPIVPANPYFIYTRLGDIDMRARSGIYKTQLTQVEIPRSPVSHNPNRAAASPWSPRELPPAPSRNGQTIRKQQPGPGRDQPAQGQ